MKLQRALKPLLNKLDRCSPYPLFYPFVMSAKEKAVFDDAIKDARHYLEFGLGGSTIRALQKSRAMIYAVESNPAWIDVMRQYVYLRFFEGRRLHVFPVSIGPVRGWGYPKSEEYKHLFERYSSSVFEAVDGRLIDVALVDGRFRVACTLKIILACRHDGGIKIMIHDFWNRPNYHILLNHLDPLVRADTIGLFSIKNDVDLQSVKNDYEAYKFSPD